MLRHLEVKERSAKEYAQTGDLMYGIAVEVKGAGMLAGVGTTLIPPSQKAGKLDIRPRDSNGL